MGRCKWNCHCSIKNNQFDESCIYSHTQSNVILISQSDIVLLFCTRWLLAFDKFQHNLLPPPSAHQTHPFPPLRSARPPLLSESTGAQALSTNSALQPCLCVCNTLGQWKTSSFIAEQQHEYNLPRSVWIKPFYTQLNLHLKDMQFLILGLALFILSPSHMHTHTYARTNTSMCVHLSYYVS